MRFYQNKPVIKEQGNQLTENLHFANYISEIIQTLKVPC